MPGPSNADVAAARKRLLEQSGAAGLKAAKNAWNITSAEARAAGGNFGTAPYRNTQANARATAAAAANRRAADAAAKKGGARSRRRRHSSRKRRSSRQNRKA